ncbi:DUF397 domain-containing protein [Actinokineospora pegani]|uniref:DUF397 domain-containing protein n=1 Tax=Actinokineospora pegani TaxID=2654637 RepID=UPI001F3901C8|nr:DUF397 domain-containing protein [Actinokineospora pegani]
MTVSDLAGAVWRKSSHSGGGNDCVELVVSRSGAAVRDSKNTESGHLAFADVEWAEFLNEVKGGVLRTR